ncbi:flavodoxin [Parashewanella spongiae]|uniref:Flavodoxin n=1 Tax=Parashewanella spongiae TaxID=342950 RepID=A0A3A6U290_9GAMM|nr:flavodoxin [Parashewanella spongiae]MCL1079846.1 flavodoxin [Parashewanella spongiae]RJY06844.1 flavodoxin [Parashewanella spongiae]
MKKVNIVFGTVYGSAQFVAETLAEAVSAAGHEVQLVESEALANFIPSESDLLLIISSTTGQGDLPDNILPWFEFIRSKGLYLPNLQYAVVGLGDSSYETFCGAANQLEALFTELGAQLITPTLKLDACETMEPEVDASAWLKTWIDE